MRAIRLIPALAPCGPLKELKNIPKWQLVPSFLLRNTPLVPCRHGGGLLCSDIIICLDSYVILCSGYDILL